MNEKPFGIYPKSYRHIAEALKGVGEIEDVILFGSRAMGNAKHGSDIDLAVVGKNLTSEQVFKLRTHLNEVIPIPYYVDVVHLDELENEALKRHIKEEGKPFLEGIYS